MYQNVLVLGAVAVEHGCNGCRTGTRTACPGLTATALPDTHFELVVTQYIDKLGVDALGESGVVLKVRADLLEVQTVYILLLEQDAVRVAHTDRGCRVGHTVYGQLGACLLGQGAGNFAGGQDGSAHVYANLNNLAAVSYTHLVAMSYTALSVAPKSGETDLLTKLVNDKAVDAEKAAPVQKTFEALRNFNEAYKAVAATTSADATADFTMNMKVEDLSVDAAGKFNVQVKADPAKLEEMQMAMTGSLTVNVPTEAVSYTHLDVYKRQLHINDGEETNVLLYDSIEQIGDEDGYLFLSYGDRQTVVIPPSAFVRGESCLLYTSRCV